MGESILSIFINKNCIEFSIFDKRLKPIKSVHYPIDSSHLTDYNKKNNPEAIFIKFKSLLKNIGRDYKAILRDIKVISVVTSKEEESCLIALDKANKIISYESQISDKSKYNFSDVHKLVFSLKDYINYRLTGINTTDFTTASLTGLLNIKEKKWDRKTIENAGFERNQLPLIKAGNSLTGILKKKIKEELDLVEDISVVNSMDYRALIINYVDLTHPNGLFIFLNNKSWIARHDNIYIRNKTTRPLLNHNGKDHIYFFDLLNVKRKIDWGIELFYKGSKDIEIDKDVRCTIQRIHTQQNSLVLTDFKKNGPGDEQFSALFGITLGIQKADIIRSIFEWVSYIIKDKIKKNSIYETDNITIFGELTRFKIFCTILSNVTDKSINSFSNSKIEYTYFSAINASNSLGYHSQGGFNNINIKTFKPSEELKEYYKKQYTISQSMKKDFAKLSNLNFSP